MDWIPIKSQNHRLRCWKMGPPAFCRNQKRDVAPSSCSVQTGSGVGVSYLTGIREDSMNIGCYAIRIWFLRLVNGLDWLLFHTHKSEVRADTVHHWVNNEGWDAETFVWQSFQINFSEFPFFAQASYIGSSRQKAGQSSCKSFRGNRRASHKRWCCRWHSLWHEWQPEPNSQCVAKYLHADW